GHSSVAHGSAAAYCRPDTAAAELHTLSLHDALPIFTSHASRLGGSPPRWGWCGRGGGCRPHPHHHGRRAGGRGGRGGRGPTRARSGEHTSELQSRENLVCRLLLEKKKPVAPPAHPLG